MLIPFWFARDGKLTYPEGDPKQSGRSGQLLDPKYPKAEWSTASEPKTSSRNAHRDKVTVKLLWLSTSQGERFARLFFGAQYNGEPFGYY
jgi:hypothetical protein